MQTGQGLVSITPKRDRMIRTEPVVMSDGRIHGVHVWSGPADDEPPERPIPGPLKWDMTLGVATDTRSRWPIAGKNPEVEVTLRQGLRGGAGRRVNSSRTKAKVLAVAVKAKPGQTLCGTWDITDWQGESIRVGFVARNDPGTGTRWSRPHDRAGDELACRT